MTKNGIPTPAFQSTRPKRSSIGQGAALSGQLQADSAPAPQSPPAEPPAQVAPSPPTTPRSDRRAPDRAANEAVSKVPAAPPELPPNKRMVGSKDILLSLPEDLKQRMINTITWSVPYTGIGQQQKFIRQAIMDLCERLEDDHNQGRPFPEPVVRNP